MEFSKQNKMMASHVPHVEDYHKKDKEFAERYDQAPLRYMERQEKLQDKQASKLRKERFQSKYD